MTESCFLSLYSINPVQLLMFSFICWVAVRTFSKINQQIIEPGMRCKKYFIRSIFSEGQLVEILQIPVQNQLHGLYLFTRI